MSRDDTRRSGDAAIAVYARDPVAGRAKTRLARDVGPERAAAIYATLLRRALAAAGAVEADRFVFLPGGDRLAPGQWPLDGFAVRDQRDGDLGARMAATFGDLFAAGYERVVLVGSDVPAIAPAALEEALARLRAADTVFGPATDGGYWLVGQRPPNRDLFSSMPWSTAAVWALTRARLTERGWSYALLPEQEDLDDGAALDRLAARGDRLP